MSLVSLVVNKGNLYLYFLWVISAISKRTNMLNLCFLIYWQHTKIDSSIVLHPDVPKDFMLRSCYFGPYTRLTKSCAVFLRPASYLHPPSTSPLPKTATLLWITLLSWITNDTVNVVLPIYANITWLYRYIYDGLSRSTPTLHKTYTQLTWQSSIMQSIYV